MPNSSQFSCSDTFESKIDFFFNMSVIWQGSLINNVTLSTNAFSGHFQCKHDEMSTKVRIKQCNVATKFYVSFVSKK